MTRVGTQQQQQLPVSPQQQIDDGDGVSKYIALKERSEPSTQDTSVSIMYGSVSSAQLPDVSRQDIAANVRILRENFDTGATQDVKVRKQLLRQLKTLMTEGESAMKEAMWKDLHKHPTEAYVAELALVNAEIQDHLDYLEDWAKPEFALTNMANLPGFSYIHREPLGVVCVISTWNYPVNLLFCPLVAALSAGNCVLLRLPGDDTTMHLNQVFISLLDKYMDNRYVRYVYGGVEETKAMLRERYDLIFATGGCFLGKIVARAAAEFLTPVVLELGGKSPVIVDETSDLALAARRIAWGAFSNSGQTCVRPDYVLVDAKIGDRFVQMMEKMVLKFYGQDPKRSESYGRIVNQRAFERMKKLLAADHDRITFGGSSDDDERYVHPTILNFRTDFDGFRKSATMSDEIFGPLLPVFYYESGNLNVPIKFIKQGEKPLALYLFSTKSSNKQRVVKATNAGSMVINDCMVQLANPHLPFGGVGNSGMGAYHGRHGFEAFSHRKPVIYKYSLLDLSARYAPYNAQGERLLRIVQYPYSRNFFRVIKLTGFALVVLIIALIINAAVYIPQHQSLDLVARELLLPHAEIVDQAVERIPPAALRLWEVHRAHGDAACADLGIVKPPPFTVQPLFFKTADHLAIQVHSLGLGFTILGEREVVPVIELQVGRDLGLLVDDRAVKLPVRTYHQQFVVVIRPPVAEIRYRLRAEQNPAWEVGHLRAVPTQIFDTLASVAIR